MALSIRRDDVVNRIHDPVELMHAFFQNMKVVKTSSPSPSAKGRLSHTFDSMRGTLLRLARCGGGSSMQDVAKMWRDAFARLVEVYMMTTLDCTERSKETRMKLTALEKIAVIIVENMGTPTPQTLYRQALQELSAKKSRGEEITPFDACFLKMASIPAFRVYLHDAHYNAYANPWQREENDLGVKAILHEFTARYADASLYPSYIEVD